MARKLIRKLKVTIIELIILLVIIVQANELAPTSSPPSSLLNLLHNPSKHDDNSSKQGLFFRCLYEKTDLCSKIPETDPWEDLNKKVCIMYFLDSFQNCFSNKLHVFDPTYYIAADCCNYCSMIVKQSQLVNFMVCIVQCYQRNAPL